ncbi:MAG: hypothetical protein A4S09_15930 [Proteobacteria bacterium SG_bin7]|nr:MAG: hypothetical protein A4S09_15930 [Proteobacteria bacterium SG_bin7]
MKKLIFGAMAVLFLAACEDEETNAIAKAQRCLDKVVGGTVASRAAAAANCKAMVSGYNSADSYSIRCAADFIGDGLDATRISNAVGRMRDAPAGVDPSMVLMGTIAFSSKAKGDEAFSDCRLSGSAGYIFFASAARVGTLVADAAGGNGGPLLTAIQNGQTPTSAEINQAIQNAGSANNADIGATAVVLFSSQCAVVTAQNQTVCNQVQTAINAGAGNMAAIGANLLAGLQP